MLEIALSVFLSSFPGPIIFSRPFKEELMNDEELKEIVTNRLHFDPTVASEDIEVSAQDGIVSITGEVESRDDRKWIEVLVRQIPEVRDVLNYLAVNYDDSENGPDVNYQSV